MKRIYLISLLILTTLFIPYYSQAQERGNFRQEGIASWYGKEFDGRLTASGEIFDSSQMTAAHPTLPFGTRVVVTNRHNNKKVTLRINDRGPFTAARIIDVSRAAAELLDMIVTGTAPVLVESIDQIIISQPSITPEIQPPVPAVTTPVPQPPAPAVTTPAPQLPAPAVITPVPQPPAPDVTTPVSQPPVPAAEPVKMPEQVKIVIPVQIVTLPPTDILDVKLTPEISINPNKNYRLQIGSYKIARNAVDAFDKLKGAGLVPNYERYVDPEKGEFFRVVIANVRGSDVQSAVRKIGSAGFTEAIIREEP
ncbi:MAG: septal ring lytic transglycosylase RlpA family protein [Treponema sp.]|jgi:rare lipoprotein A|nr:septal ring lytic transglycosylase RlpA family protein [Treponema sp.]